VKPTASAPAKLQQKIMVVGLRREGSFIPLRNGVGDRCVELSGVCS
jgi:hypothetical protein